MSYDIVCPCGFRASDDSNPATVVAAYSAHTCKPSSMANAWAGAAVLIALIAGVVYVLTLVLR